MTTSIVTLLSDYNVISIVVASVVAFLAGSLVATILWFRWFFSDQDMEAIETYANRSWGD